MVNFYANLNSLRPMTPFRFFAHFIGPSFFLMFACIALAQPGVPQDINTYLAKFLNQDEDFAKAKLDLKGINAKNAEVLDVYQSTLSLQPNYFNRVQTFSLTGLDPIEQSRRNIAASWVQTLPTGTSLKLDGSKFLDPVNSTVGGQDSDYRIFLEQSLWRNPFGLAMRKKKAAAEVEHRQLSIAAKSILIQRCVSATELFVAAYIQQERYKIKLKLLENAKQALTLAERSRRNRVSREIDVLTARTDFFKVQADMVRSEAEWSRAEKQLWIQSGVLEPKEQPSLSSPAGFFKKLQTPKAFDPAMVAGLLELNEKLETTRLRYEAAKLDNRTKVDFGVGTGQTNSISATGVGFNRVQDHFTQVYFKLELPLINKVNEGAMQTSYLQFQLAEVERQKLEKQLRYEFSRLVLEEQRFVRELDYADKSQSARSAQLHEASSLLRAGRLNFDEFIRYRDSYFNEQLNSLDLNLGLWQARMKLSQFDQKLADLCFSGDIG